MRYCLRRLISAEIRLFLMSSDKRSLQVKSGFVKEMKLPFRPSEKHLYGIR